MILKIEQETWYQAYIGYCDSIDTICKEADEQVSIFENSNESFRGMTADTVRQRLYEFYYTGKGRQFIEHLEQMKGFYSCSLKEIASLQLYCDRIVNTLYEDDYVCTYSFITLIDEELFTGKTLYCNQNMTDQIVSLCDSALAEADTIYQTLKECMRTISDYEETSALEAAYRKLYRLENLKASVRNYDMMITDFVNGAKRELGNISGEILETDKDAFMNSESDSVDPDDEKIKEYLDQIEALELLVSKAKDPNQLSAYKKRIEELENSLELIFAKKIDAMTHKQACIYLYAQLREKGYSYEERARLIAYMESIDGLSAIRETMLTENFRDSQGKAFDRDILEIALRLDELRLVPTMQAVNEFWLYDPMFASPYWYQNEDNMKLAITYFKSELVMEGPYVIIKTGELTELERLKNERIGVLIRLLANAEINGADDRLLPALENTCVRYGEDLYDGIGYDSQNGFIITEEFLDILILNEQERIGQKFGFWMERGGEEIIEGILLMGMAYAYVKGTPSGETGGKYTEEEMEIEIEGVDRGTGEVSGGESNAGSAEAGGGKVDANFTEGGNYSSLRDLMPPEEIARYDEHWLDVAEQISNEALDNQIQFIKNGGITKPGGGAYKPAKISATVDLNTGDIYLGYNGTNKFNPSRIEIYPSLQERINNTMYLAENASGNPYASRSSFQLWSVDNCAEVYSSNLALHNGASLDNILINTKEFISGKWAPPCENCKVTFEGMYFPKKGN